VSGWFFDNSSSRINSTSCDESTVKWEKGDTEPIDVHRATFSMKTWKIQA
jgi:hypothetical protein